MGVNTILGNKDFVEFLRGKSATFLLSLSVTKTSEIYGITQAGIPGKIYLTPTLDAEFLASGEVKSLEDIATTAKGVPTPALISRAIHILKPYSNIEFLDLGLVINPKLDYFKRHSFDIKPSESIVEGANINALDIFQKGVEFGKNYKCKDDYIILAESVPSGTTTAETTAKALGYSVDGMFSSSFKDVPNDIKKISINKALENIKQEDDLFQKISMVSDNMIIFNAGFILGNSSTDTKLVLAGGTQMAAVLLLVNSILRVMGGELNSKNLALFTTKWVANDRNSDIKALLKMLDFKINAFYSDFDFFLSSHPALKMYDDGEAKEGVGAGASLCYGFLNGLYSKDIIKKIESLLSIEELLD